MPGIGRLSVVALDCPSPRPLAEFYRAITGWEIDRDDGDWVRLRGDGRATLAFQQADDYKPPLWPGADRPQQLHVDFDVADLDEAERRVMALGARKADFQPGSTFRVFLDPVGHPFCLVLVN
jgi:predicted enzyme related to lactoylglutathione lyase